MICIGCHQEKSPDYFYDNKTAPSGKDCRCKECRKARSRKNRAARIDYFREQDRKRGQLPRRAHARMSYQKSERGRIAHNKATRSYGENHPARRAAHIAVGNAIRDGVLSRQPCEICGRLAQAHHDDYSKPLIVRWLCARHHAAWHKHNIPKYPEDESEKRSTS